MLRHEDMMMDPPEPNSSPDPAFGLTDAEIDELWQDYCLESASGGGIGSVPSDLRCPSCGGTLWLKDNAAKLVCGENGCLDLAVVGTKSLEHAVGQLRALCDGHRYLVSERGG